MKIPNFPNPLPNPYNPLPTGPIVVANPIPNPVVNPLPQPVVVNPLPQPVCTNSPLNTPHLPVIKYPVVNPLRHPWDRLPLPEINDVSVPPPCGNPVVNPLPQPGIHRLPDGLGVNETITLRG